MVVTMPEMTIAPAVWRGDVGGDAGGATSSDAIVKGTGARFDNNDQVVDEDADEKVVNERLEVVLMLVVCIIRCCSRGGSFDMYGCKANEAGEGHTLHIDDFVAANYAQNGFF